MKQLKPVVFERKKFFFFDLTKAGIKCKKLPSKIYYNNFFVLFENYWQNESNKCVGVMIIAPYRH